ncbi:hypothetical protein ACIBP6_08115 [Nonomuraea terrae]|uniref:hypothetical protein n=1 Tax=Nonomuraea terrae TaxID=2530383 RepID=UPI0037900150
MLRRRGRGLLAFGAAHGLLLFPGDVLGLLGLLMCRLMRVRGRMLPATAAAWLVPVAVISALVYGGPSGTTQRAYLWSLAVPDRWRRRRCGSWSG